MALAIISPQALDGTADPVLAVLTMCERGRAALVEAVSVVEAKNILDAVSTLEYAVKVRDMNQEAVVAASRLRIRAERRVGELLAAQNLKSGPKKLVTAPDQLSALSEIGITKNQSSSFQRLASVPPERFDRALETVTQPGRAVTREAVLREIDPRSERTPHDGWKDGDRFKTACDRVAELADAAADAIQWRHFPGPNANDVGRTAMLLSLRAARAAIDRIDTLLTRPR